ncbi:ATP-dependent DNA helicase RecG [Candidatus Daviesbacteria bacterium]|nr:ATP-dependent DNA helicase RecG [Candidatus Daviesbacteria bacterium]
MNLNSSLLSIPGIGSYFSWKLKKLNLNTLEDLIYHFPFRYDDFSAIKHTLEAQIGDKVTIIGEVWSIKNIYTRYGKVLTQAIFNDGTSPVTLTWFNSAWLTKQIKAGDRLQVSGKISKYKNRFSIMMPVWEKISEIRNNTPASRTKSEIRNPLHTGRLVPVYPETEGLSSKWLRAKISFFLPKILPQIEDPLPNRIKENMLDLTKALGQVHFPSSWGEIEKARQRLGFDELFYLQLATLKSRHDWELKPTIEKFQISNFKFQIVNFLDNLPFKLTTAQQKVIDEIMVDFEKTTPMNRLVQGEVGSGKTVVAAAAAFIAYLNGFKTLYMAPTEILAFQHYTTLSDLFKSFSVGVGIYTGSRKFTSSSLRAKRSNLKKKIASSPSAPRNDVPDIIVGTHALLSSKLPTENVGLVIVDEQQRFGVEQRSLLRSKAKVPHFLTMTATPIPRTVALTLYGDLDLSIIDKLPKGRKKVKTYVVPNKKRSDAYKFIEKKVRAGGQVYIITPLIEESETMLAVKAVKVEFERLKKEIFPKLNLGLLHGRLKSKEKEQVISDFKDGKINILVSTSVVEVGVDVKNATIMLIEGAERFGLAQLHQLRGRVGREEKQSYCLLFPSTEESSIKSRLKNLERIFDGLKLAELDLKIRGSGEIFGARQSGRFELKIASFQDLNLIEKTRAAAKQILAEDSTLAKYPQLALKLETITSGAMPD